MESNIEQEKCEFCGEYVPSYSTIYVASEKKYLFALCDTVCKFLHRVNFMQ
jgi:ribosomal protein L24E